uniref:Uncharacterized protein n=1 Tax=Anguilla anguilla TaxID=7936 RepID=A0A0E9PUJ7_ANGAN
MVVKRVGNTMTFQETILVGFSPKQTWPICRSHLLVGPYTMYIAFYF